MSLLGHWIFNEGSGASVADESGNGYDATLSIGTEWTTDDNYGTIYHLGRTVNKEFCTIPNTMGMDSSLSEMNIKFTLKNNYDSSQGTDYPLCCFSENMLLNIRSTPSERRIYMGINGSTKITPDNWGSYLSWGKWYTHEIRIRANDKIEWWIDGELDATLTTVGTFGNAQNKGNYIFGGRSSTLIEGALWDADIKEFQIYTTFSGQGAPGNTIVRAYTDEGTEDPISDYFNAVDTGLAETDFTLTYHLNGVTTAVSNSLTEVGDGWYQWEFQPTKNGDWELFISRNSTSEEWYKKIDDDRLNPPTVSQTNNYKIDTSSGLIIYKKRVEVSEITKAKVIFDRTIDEFTVITSPEADKTKVNVKKGSNFFEVYGDKRSVVECQVLLTDRLNDGLTRQQNISPPVVDEGQTQDQAIDDAGNARDSAVNIDALSL